MPDQSLRPKAAGTALRANRRAHGQAGSLPLLGQVVSSKRQRELPGAVERQPSS
jgi:hypothetical protein